MTIGGLAARRGRMRSEERGEVIEGKGGRTLTSQRDLGASCKEQNSQVLRWKLRGGLSG